MKNGGSSSLRYAFCEAVTAGPGSAWHIRPLTDAGLKPGGGVDTPSFCGHVRPPYGWDLEVSIDEHHLGHTCGECAKRYRTATAAGRVGR